MKHCPTLLWSLLSQCQSIRDTFSTALPFIFPVIGSINARRELWVAKRRIQMQGGKEEMWDAAHVWVWVTPSFLPLQERSPCPLAHSNVICSHPGGEAGCNRIKHEATTYIQLLWGWFQAGLGFCTSPGCCSKVAGEPAHVQRHHGEGAKYCQNPAGGEQRIAPDQQPAP